MNLSFRTVSIAGSLVIAGLLILGAYVFSGPSALRPSIATADTTDEALKAFAAKDSDSDGLPDWEEALYGTNPKDAHSVDKTLTDSEAVTKGLVKPKFSGFPAPDAPASGGTNAPVDDGTITGQFMQKFFGQYLAAQATGSAAPDISAYVDQAIADLVRQNELAPPYALKDLTGTTLGALIPYSAASENAFRAVTADFPESDISYFYDGVTKEDATALRNVGTIGRAYLGAAKALSKFSVPNELLSSHLALINAMALIGKADTDMETLKKDPLRAMLGIGEYRDGVKALLTARTALGDAYKRERVTLSPGTPGYFFYTFVTNVANNPTP